MKIARLSPAIFYENDKIYVIGGRNADEEEELLLKSCEVFHYITMQWDDMPDLIVPIDSAKIFSYNNELWCLQRHDPSLTGFIQIFSKSKNEWTVIEHSIPISNRIPDILLSDKPDEILIASCYDYYIMRINLHNKTKIYEKNNLTRTHN